MAKRTRTYDPNTRRLRRFILLVIFVVTLPSLMLSGFGLIAIRNERSAAYRQLIQLYRPVMAKLQDALTNEFSSMEKSAAQPLESLALWAARKAPAPADSLRTLRTLHPALVNFFAMDDKGDLLYPSSQLRGETFDGFLPERFLRGRQLEFQSNAPCKAVGVYRSLLGEFDGSPAKCEVFKAIGWQMGNANELKEECERMLGSHGLEPGLKCMTRGALARSLDRCGKPKAAAEEFGRLADFCPSFLNAKGYNLALGARLRSLELLVGTDREGALVATGQLVSALADPLLPASLEQKRFLARRASRLLVRMDADPKAQAYLGALNSMSRSSELFSQMASVLGNLPKGVSFRSVKAAGSWRMLVVDRQDGVISGAEITPRMLELSLKPLLVRLNVGGRVRAQIRSANQVLGDDEDLSLAGTWLIPRGQFAWRLDLAFVQKGQMDELANARTRLYAWILVLLVVILAIGISATVWIMVRESRLSRLKTDFVSNVSHELRTPLTSIRLFTDTLLMDRTSGEEEKKEFLQIISTESDRLSRLVERILDFSRMEAGRRAYVFEPVHVSSVVDAAAAACCSLARQKDIGIDLDIPADIIPADLDHDAMVEVVINLLSNAIKYSPAKKRVKVRAWSEENYLMISVEDHGIGIPKSEQEKIFEKFYRVETPLSSDVSGSGLGLSLVRYIVRGHGGTVSVKSARSKGSTFMVRIPLSHDESG